MHGFCHFDSLQYLYSIEYIRPLCHAVKICSFLFFFMQRIEFRFYGFPALFLSAGQVEHWIKKPLEE